MNSLKLILSNKRYLAAAVVFASLNILTGTWVLYLPHVKLTFGLNDGQIGIALFCSAVGLLFSIPFVPPLVKKLGVGQATKISILLFTLSFNLPLAATNYLMLCVSLFVVGMLSGFTDISMNALVSAIERKHRVHFMSAAHGFFSLGGFIGVGLGSILLSVFATPAWHMACVSIVMLLLNWYFSKFYIQVQEVVETTKKEHFSLKKARPFIGLAIVSFIFMFNEGSVEHWSNLFLFDIVKVPENQAGFGFIAFSLCMTIGRFLGDGISEKIGAINIIIGGSILAFIGYIAIISANFYLTVFGFGLIGAGCSGVIPEIFKLASQVKGVAASVGISIVSGIGYIGFLLGPVLLGFISNSLTLVWSFIFLACTVFVALCLALFQLKKR